jgi:hypothetical protein
VGVTGTELANISVLLTTLRAFNNIAGEIRAWPSFAKRNDSNCSKHSLCGLEVTTCCCLLETVGQGAAALLMFLVDSTAPGPQLISGLAVHVSDVVLVGNRASAYYVCITSPTLRVLFKIPLLTLECARCYRRLRWARSRGNPGCTVCIMQLSGLGGRCSCARQCRW